MRDEHPKLQQDEPREVVRRQLDAYNDRDIEAFMTHWADDAQLFAFPSELLASGAAEIRARHIARFKEPNLFGRLLARMAVGNLVIDHEVVTRTFPEGPGTVEVTPFTKSQMETLRGLGSKWARQS